MSCISFFYILLLFTSKANGDYYSSISGLEKLIYYEKYMLENLDGYMEIKQHERSYLRDFMNNVEQAVKSIENITFSGYGKALIRFKAIKRFNRDWLDYKHIVFKRKHEDEYQERLNAYEVAKNFTRPNFEDLKGAAMGISRLQQIYHLKTCELANGTIMGKKMSDEMTTFDCFELGLKLFWLKDYENSAAWLLETRRKWLQEQTTKSFFKYNLSSIRDEHILTYLVPAVLETGNTKFARLLAKEHLSIKPADLTALINLRKVEERLKKERFELAKGVTSETAMKSDTVKALFEKACRGEFRQLQSDQRELYCGYKSNNAPYCSIAPFKIEVLSLDPYITIYYDAISNSESENIIQAASQIIRRSKISDHVVSDKRISKTSWLDYAQHNFLKNLTRRLGYITGLSLETAESLQVANYGIGGYYDTHYDFFQEKYDIQHETGKRMLTALFYINDVDLGGATAFPYLKLAIQPQKNSLVLWYNLHRSLELDFRMEHGGCPVIKGSKWICTVWYHTVGQEFRRPCELQPDGYKSKNFSRS